MAASRAGAAAVPVAFLLANAASYALLLAAAHTMTSADYGALSSLLGLLLISTIPMLAVQTVTARRAATAAGPGGIVRGTAEVSAAATVLLAALSPALALFLHLHDVVGVLLVAATVPANAVLGIAIGVAQGQRRFTRLAAVILASTGGRSLGGLAGLLLHDTPDATLAGVLAGTALAALVVAGGRAAGRHRAALFDRDRHGVVAETVRAGFAHGTFLLLTSLDVLLARHVLSAHDAGVYAVGSVVTRATVWLPQSVILLLFASLAESHRHRDAARRSAGTVLALGVLCVAGTAVLGSVVVSVVGGAKYHELDHTIWLFAVLGSLLAVLQLGVLAGLAQRTARRAALLWATVAVDVVVVLAAGDDTTPTRLVVTLVTVSAVSASVSLWLTLRADQVAVSPGHGPAANAGSSPLPNWDATPDATG